MGEKRIVGLVRPFEINQRFLIYDGYTKISETNFSIQQIEEKILNLAKTENIENIDLIGPHAFLKEIKDNILTKELSLYNKNSLKINLK